MSGNFYLDVIIIVLIQSLLLYLYDFFITKYREKKSDPLIEKLDLIKAILVSTKHDRILSIEQIQEIELHSQAIYIFSKNMFRDVKNSGQFSKDLYNIGTFYPTVQSNLRNTDIKYSYFIKKDSHWKHFIHSFYDSYRSITDINTKVNFHMIKSNKYFFYDEIYLYESKEGEFSAFEFLPSISDEKEKRLFYLDLDKKQVQRLITIKDSLQKKYPKISLLELMKGSC